MARLFLAINLDPGVRDAIVEAAEPLRLAAPDVRWVDAPRVHLTIKFLGEQPEDVVPRIAGAMDRVVASHKPFPIRIAQAGAFPNFRRARVVWMGIDHEPRLELLHHDVELACEALGYELEGRAFRPHLTLGRVRQASERDPDAMRRLARAAKSVTLEVETVVTSVDLMRSHASSAGSRYERLHVAAMATA